MASFLIFSLLLTLSATATATSAISINFTTFNIAPVPSHISSPPPSPPLPLLSVLPQQPPTHLQDSPQQQQFNSIIDSIVGAGDFSNWAHLLAQADPSIFPLTATLFIPEDGAFLAGNSPPPATSVNSVDPLLFPYHIVPRRFTFSELRQFPSGARLPTLLPGKTLIITNNSVGNFTVNGAPLTHPDLFQSSVVSVHGIGNVLDYDTFGEDASSPENSLGWIPSPENTPDSVPSPPSPELKQNGRGQAVGFPKSVASCAAKSQGQRSLGIIIIIIVGVMMVLVVSRDDLGLHYDFWQPLLNLTLAVHEIILGRFIWRCGL